jgi:multiple sugar transport system ATP-binding protein
LKRLHQELGTTMVYVTHDQAEAMTLAGRIAIVRNGSIVQIGAPLELYRRPANTFVATFLGNPPMNIVDEMRGGVAVKLGIRPEDVQVAISPQDGWDSARVLVVEPMGSEMLVTIEWRDVQLIARTVSDLPIESGTQVWVNLPMDRLHTFDADGNRMSRTSEFRIQ